MLYDLLYPLCRFHGWLHEKSEIKKKQKALYNRFMRPFLAMRRSGKSCMFLIMTPEHGNIGDQAIAYAEICMLQQLGIEHVEISEYQLRALREADYLHMLNGYPILLQGGGYLGTIWYDVEVLLRELIAATPKSTVLMFPNTIYYEQSNWGQEELALSIELYNRHKHLHLNAREAVSYALMKECYRYVKLVPDIVLSLDPYVNTKSRNGCLLCLRNDCEKTRSDNDDSIIIEQVKTLFGNRYLSTDMCVGRSVTPETREQEIIQKFDEFCGAEVVITDRLHAMIFCAITQTPCIVIDSQSPKVKGCYEWIKQCEFIRFAEDVTQIETVYQQVSCAPRTYSNQHLTTYYEKLKADICLHVKKGSNPYAADQCDRTYI